MNRQKVFICSPLHEGNFKANMERARRYCRKVFEAGYNPICPHIYYPQFLDDSDPAERQEGMNLALSQLRGCRTLIVCGDVHSDGMIAEIKQARELGKMVATLDGILAAPKSGR